MPRPRFRLPAVRPIASAALALVLAGGALPVPTTASPERAADADAAVAPEQVTRGSGSGTARGTEAPSAPIGQPEAHPSIAYEEAMAHEGDRITFEPGGRVATGFGAPCGRRVADRRSGPAGAPGRPRHWTGDGGQRAGQPMDQGPRVDATRTGRARAGHAGDTRRRPGPEERSPDPDATRVAYVDADEPGVDLAAASGLRRQVFGFLPYWELYGASSSSTTTSCRRSPTSRSARTRTATSRRRTATARTPPAGAAGRARR